MGGRKKVTDWILVCGFRKVVLIIIELGLAKIM